MLPVSLDCPFLIALRCSLTVIFTLTQIKVKEQLNIALFIVGMNIHLQT